MSINKHGHLFKRFDKELSKLGKQLATMGDLVSNQMDKLQIQLQDIDNAEFDEIIENDSSINGMEVKISKTVLKLLARRAPMGSDLRFIIACSRIVTDIERIGDEVVSMAKGLSVNKSLGNCDEHDVVSDLQELVAKATNLMDRVLLAFQNDDESTAYDIINNDVKKEGGAFRQNAEKLVACVQDHYDSMDQSFNVAMQVNALTRISDHVCNICEHIVFLTSGEDIRHTDEC